MEVGELKLGHSLDPGDCWIFAFRIREPGGSFHSR